MVDSEPETLDCSARSEASVKAKDRVSSDFLVLSLPC